MVALLALLLSLDHLGVGSSGSDAYPTTSLCSALAAIEDGERMPITVVGIYTVGHEHQFFYDPRMPRCPENVQPSTWVEFAPSMAENAELIGLLQDSGRAYVTFRGELQGPGKIPADEQNASSTSYLSWISKRRYGHLDAFRTQLVVESIVDVEQVPESVGREGVRNPPPSPVEPAAPTHLDVPGYPPLAQRGGISGDVTIRVRIEKGRIVETDVLSGDRVLAQESLENLETWLFDPEAELTCEVTYSYRLERRAAGASASDRVELELPSRVLVIAPALDW